MFFSGSICHQAFAHTDTRSNILANYSYHDYLRCLTQRLGPFLSDNDFVYLLNKATPVFAHGRITMVLHEPRDHYLAHLQVEDDPARSDG
jgi:hypothetical protein